MTRSCTLGTRAALASFLVACATRGPTEPPQQEQLTRAVAPPERRAPPAALPPEARLALRQHMTNHARAMGDLVSVIMVLEYPRIAENATRITKEISQSRAAIVDGKALVSLLPDDFFKRQDELAARATTLAQAAAQQSAFDVADAYGALSAGCVGCHAVYRPAAPGSP